MAEHDAVRILRAVDTINEASDKVIGRATVLSRLFEATAATHEPGGVRVDFGDEHEREFWIGLRDIVDEIAQAQSEVQQAVKAVGGGDE